MRAVLARPQPPRRVPSVNTVPPASGIRPSPNRLRRFGGTTTIYDMDKANQHAIRLGKRLLEDLLGLGVTAEIVSETDGSSSKARLRTGGTKRAARGDMYFGRIRVNVPQTEGSLAPRDGRRYFCIIRLKDLSIDRKMSLS